MTYPTPLIDDSAHTWVIVRLGLKGGDRERERGREREGQQKNVITILQSHSIRQAYTFAAL